jgi:hypothetical protein
MLVENIVKTCTRGVTVLSLCSLLVITRLTENCTFYSSVQLSLEIFFAPINLYRVMHAVPSEMHIDLRVKCRILTAVVIKSTIGI